MAPPATSPARRWAIGLVLGAVLGFGVLVVGIMAAVVGVVALAMLAWERGRTAPIGGVLIGFGAIWVVLFTRVELSCNVDCEGPDVTKWIAIGLALVATGIALSVFALRPTRMAGLR